MKIQARVEDIGSSLTHPEERHLVVVVDGKTQPYLFIPDTFSDEVLEEMIKRLEGK